MEINYFWEVRRHLFVTYSVVLGNTPPYFELVICIQKWESCYISFCRKMSWTPTFVILFSANLVFYKDQKAAAQVPFDSTNWNFGQVVKICNFAKFKITEMWPFLLCHVEGFSKVSPTPPPPIFWWIFIPYTTSSLYCTKVLLSLIMKTNSKLHYVAQVNLMNLRTA